MSAGELFVVAVAYLVGCLVMMWKLSVADGYAPWTWALLLLPPIAAALGLSRVGWQCGVCGRHNKTPLIVYVLQWCDHGGDFN